MIFDFLNFPIFKKKFNFDIFENCCFCVTGADSNLRDYSGKKAYQYLARQGTSISSDTFRSEYSNKSPFDRGGLYSSLRNSLLKFNNNNNYYNNNNNNNNAELGGGEFKSPASASSASPDAHDADHHRDFDRRIRTLSKSFLREFRPSVRKRASMNEFANYTT